mgnify:CR=1 FL=1
MALDKSDVIGSIFSGWWEADKADTAQRLKIRNEELANKQNTIKQIKTNNYNDDIAKYKKDKVVIDGLNAVAANKSMYTTDMQLGEAVLMAKHGDNFDKFKKSMTGADGDLTRFYTLAKNEGINFNETGVDGTQVKKDFKDKSVIEAEYLAEISKIEAETKAALEEAAGDSKTVNAILKLKDRLIGNLKPDSSKVDAIDSVNNTMSTKDGLPKNEKEVLTDVQENISTGKSSTETETDTSTDTTSGSTEVEALKAVEVGEKTGTIPLFIPDTWKTNYNKKMEDAQKLDFSSKEYTKKISDTVLILVPNAQTEDYFNLDKDNKIISAKTPIVNADNTIQSLMTNSLDDVNQTDLFKQTGKDVNKINFSANERFALARNHVEDYGTWYADGKVLGKDGDFKNLFKKESVALLVPANSIININNGTLKGYSESFGTIPKDLRKGVGSIYQNFIVNKANERQKVEGGTLEDNINFLQRQIEADNNGNETLTQEARAVIANALLTAKKSGGELYYPEINKKVSESKNKSESKTSSTADMKQEELGSGADKEDFGSVRKITIKDKETGQDTIVPLTTKNKIWLTKNYPEVNLAVDQDTMTGDAKIAETIANETVKEKIKPADLGIKNQPVFETLESIKAILPYKMSGQEIMDKYEIGFKINKFTEFSPSK